MRYVELGTSEIRASVLGFGCSAIMGRVGKAQSLRALHTAFDGGVTLYDTARSYGYGESEGVLGEFLQGRRDKVVVSTKFGIVPVKQSFWKRSFKPAVRGALRIVPSARSIIRQGVQKQFVSHQFTSEVLRQSVEESLRQLRTDRIDILFMHSPDSSIFEQHDVFSGMARLIAEGKIRLAGISADFEAISAAALRNIEPLSVLQFPVNVFDMSLAEKLHDSNFRRCALFANQPFGGINRVRECWGRICLRTQSDDLPEPLRAKLHTADGLVLPELILNLIVASTGIHCVIPSMIDLDHIKSNIRAVENCRFTLEELVWIRERTLESDVVGDRATFGSQSLLLNNHAH